jgi:hypothetical protein
MRVERSLPKEPPVVLSRSQADGPPGVGDAFGRWVAVLDRVELLDGDARAAEGVSGLAIGGHTPGCMRSWSRRSAAGTA